MIWTVDMNMFSSVALRGLVSAIGVGGIKKEILAEFGRIYRDLCLPESSIYFNDLQRLLIVAMHFEHGDVWLGYSTLPRFPVDKDKDVVMWEWDGKFVYNFNAQFVIPKYDKELDNLIHDRHNETYTGTVRDSKWVDAIQNRIFAIGGHDLTWT